MRPISTTTTKRLYSIAASPPLKSAVRSTPTSPRPRRTSFSLSSAVSSPGSSSSTSAPSNSVGSSGSRSLYTNSSSLHYFESAGVPPPPPLPPSRPGSSRLSPGEQLGEVQPQSTHHNGPANNSGTNGAQTPHSPHSAPSEMPQQSSHGQSNPGQTNGHHPYLGSSLLLSFNGPAPSPGSSPPDHGMLLNGPRSGLAPGPAWRAHEAVADGADKTTKEEGDVSAVSADGSRKMFQLEVGAYGIPKRGREAIRARTCVCPTCLEQEELFSLEHLENAVQVGEDAYFVRDDALGVADGVGGWGSRHTTARTSSGMHTCSVCAAASSSKLGHQGQVYRQHFHRSRPIQPSPSALFARRLMHFCASEVGEARAAAATTNRMKLATADRSAEPVSVGAKLSLKNGGVAPRAGRQKTVVREFGNARPFAWPWDKNVQSDESLLGTLIEEEIVEKTTAAFETSDQDDSPVSNEAGAASSASDPPEDTIDPVDVLERAYNKTIDAHRICRRIRVVKERKAAPRWWSYGLGLGSGTSSSSSSTSLHETSPIERDKFEDFEWEWQEYWEPLAIGSSTALLAVLSGDKLRVAHLGDCVGWLVRAGEIVWRSEEMWWGFNYPVQLGPSSPTRPTDARRYEIPIQADDILILASDGVSDNCWEEDVLDEVRRAVEVHLPLAQDSQVGGKKGVDSTTADLLGRRTLAGMLSEALSSRARQLSMQGRSCRRPNNLEEEEELPFARRAREEGKPFRGGKSDDISVLVAIISPVACASEVTTSGGGLAVREGKDKTISTNSVFASSPATPANA